MDKQIDQLRDPRERNQKLDDGEQNLIVSYLEKIGVALNELGFEKILEFANYVEQLNKSDNQLYFVGNGGSAAAAEHMACDFLKGTYFKEKFKLKVSALSSNTSLLTAISNDFGYEHSFSFQLEAMARKGDILVLISSSGQSENILNAAIKARELGVKTVGLTGFSGGKMSGMVDLNLHVNASHYGVIEDAHMHICHLAIHLIQKKYAAE